LTPEIAKEIRVQMAILDISKATIGKYLGVTRQAVSKAFQEHNDTPLVEKRIIELFQKPMDELEEIFKGS